MADVLTVRKRFNVNVNDALMAIIGGSLRRYYLEKGGLPEASLVTSMPVSLRSADDDEFGNRLATALIPLATDIEDPVGRLMSIHRHTSVAKAQVRGQGEIGFLDVIEAIPPLVVSALNNLSSPEQKALMSGSNLVVSYVHNSPTPFYMKGAKIEAFYPISIIADGVGLNITAGRRPGVAKKQPASANRRSKKR